MLYSANPPATTLSSYSPAAKPSKLKFPSEPDVVMSTLSVLWLTTRTVALGTAAPLMSKTVPASLLDAFCAPRRTARGSNRHEANNETSNFTFRGKGRRLVDGFSMALNLLSIAWMREGDSLLTMSGYPRDRTSADCGNNDSSRIRRVAIADVHWDSSFERISCTTALQLWTNSCSPHLSE